jgi:tetratricopeptide (TPR) repeat protein
MAADGKDKDRPAIPTAIDVSADRKERPLVLARPASAGDDDKDRALVLRRQMPMIARDLDQAAKGQLVYVGRDGEVKDPARVRNRQVAWYLAFGGIMAAGVALAATSLPVMIPFYAALCGRLVGQVRAVKRVNQASAALSNGDIATGRALAEPISRAWWAPGRVRILAELRVAFADALEGRGEQALERLRQARAKLSPRLVQYQFSYYTEINLLIALGRVKEARALFDARGPIPSGEVLRFSHWIAEMHLGVAEGKLDIDETELDDRRRKGLSMTTGRDLLLLCAWAYAQRGEHDDAAFAWRQAMEREGSPRIDVTMPGLVAWMTGYLREHPELEHPEPDEEM